MVVITDTDAVSYSQRRLAKVLKSKEKGKCMKYEQACKDRQHDFVPLAYLIDGLPGARAKVAERQLAALLATAWDRPYLDVVNFVQVRMALAIMCSNTMLL